MAGETSEPIITFDADKEGVDPIKWEQAWFGHRSALMVVSDASPYEFQLWFYDCGP